ncbi:MAG TPA: DUF3951 domain-containing protein [Bacillales bacterium]|nr:DUF3951 domain-containing protein [Bacillales bacterium]
MNFTMLITLSLLTPILVLIGYVVIKTLITQRIPDSRYHPFDYVMGQTPVELHEEKETQEDEEEPGDDEDKNSL